ncbi:GNAT family N-acetyltransferase [Brevibacillus fulvus]|uniref:GNAT family N-acyltransferase n=1 Tax=Brevibacillus fulvus TaxID=1125967 RepID=A0A938XWS0_9BACL|nr:GNAT family N-acetyltransferase [Brevibacillus fulvus]MBM7589078.1 putative GNAT family N-acyltransferase [Brevibacillus fulvus]
MEPFRFLKGYQTEELYRASLHELAERTFGIDLETWYQAGYWTDKYIPYSFVDEGRVVANVSVNKITLLVEGECKPAVQIGTVMTDPAYRNKGLANSLMQRVLADWDSPSTVLYLFANRTVLDFYPKYGFRPVPEQQYRLHYAHVPATRNLRKLDGSKREDQQFLFEFARDRVPLSRIFSATHTAELFMFYCLSAFRQDAYYLPEEEAIVIFQADQAQLHLFDIISKKPIRLDNILKSIVRTETTEIVFHFTPDDRELDFQLTPYAGSEVMFAKVPAGYRWPAAFKHPLTAQA